MNDVKEKKSIVYKSRHSEFKSWMHDFSELLKAHSDHNTFVYPEEFATGFAKIYTIEPGLTYRIVDYHLNTDLIFSHDSSKEFFIIIYFYHYSNCENLLLEINGKRIVEIGEGDNYDSLLMTNSFMPIRLEVKKDTDVQGLTIQITEKWLQEKIKQHNTSNYALFKQKKIFQSFITPKSQELLSDIFAENKSVVPSLYMNNRVLRLLESFFDRILKEDSTNSYPDSSKEAINLLKIKSILLENAQSGFPSMDSLSRIALMSSAKLKIVFKKSFGMSMYEFYQKNRMYKAKELLENKNCSISEAGILAGYKNLSNFSNAFKKEFGCLPKDFKKIR